MKSLQVGWRKRDFLNFPCALQEENMLLLCSCYYPTAPPYRCLLLSLDALQKGRVALQHLETAGSSVSPKLSLAVGQHWRSSSGPCTVGGVHRCGAGPGAGRGGRPWSGGRAGTAAPRLQIPVALRLPPHAGGGRNWPSVKFTYFDL